MKKLLLTAAVLFLAGNAFCQALLPLQDIIQIPYTMTKNVMTSNERMEIQCRFIVKLPLPKGGANPGGKGSTGQGGITVEPTVYTLALDSKANGVIRLKVPDIDKIGSPRKITALQITVVGHGTGLGTLIQSRSIELAVSDNMAAMLAIDGTFITLNPFNKTLTMKGVKVNGQ